MTGNSTDNKHSPMVWPTLKYDDAPAAVRFLQALGFKERLVVPGEKPDTIAHAEGHIWSFGTYRGA